MVDRDDSYVIIKKNNNNFSNNSLIMGTKVYWNEHTVLYWIIIVQSINFACSLFLIFSGFLNESARDGRRRLKAAALKSQRQKKKKT